MWDIFSYLHAFSFVIVKSALHSINRNVKTDTCFVFFLKEVCCTLSPTSRVMFPFSMFGHETVPDYTAWWEDKHSILGQAIFLHSHSLL